MTVFVYSVFVWLPLSAAVKVKLYFVPFMVKLPDFDALELIVYDAPVDTSCTFAVTVDVLFASDWESTDHAI